MAKEIRKRDRIGISIQGGVCYSFEGEGLPNEGSTLEIKELNDTNAPIGSKYTNLETGEKFTKMDTTPEISGKFKLGKWYSVGSEIVGQKLMFDGYILNLTSSGSDRCVTSSPLPSNTGEEMIVETRFHTTTGTSYSVNIEGANGLLIGKFGNELICGFNGGGNFTTSVGRFDENITGTDLKMIYKRSTGEISIFCNGNKIALASDTINSVSELLGGNLSLGSRYSPANNFTDGFFDYFKITVDGTPVVDYQFNEGSGTTVADSVNGYNLTIEGTGYSWQSINKKRENALNIAIIGDSNAVSRNSENDYVPSDLPIDGNIDSGAYWNGSNFVQYSLNMNLGGDVQPDSNYGVEYRICQNIKTELEKNTNIIKYALGGSKCTDGGAWNSVNGSLMRGFLSQTNKSRIELDAIVVFLGENSATNTTDANNYENEQTLLIQKLRNTIKNGINIPIILIRLYDFTAANIAPNIGTIQAAHDNIGKNVKSISIVQPQNISGVKSDEAHFDGFGIDSLGVEIFKQIKRGC